MTPSKILVFTDLDGTLLDHNYSYTAAKPALARLRQLNIPLILNTSKTADELFALVKELQLGHPFVVENGGAVLIPPGYFDLSPAEQAKCVRLDNGYVQLPLGKPSAAIIDILAGLRRQGFRFRGFADMTPEALMQETGLSRAAAVAAKQRASSEPLIWLDTEDNLSRFENILLSSGLTLIKGGQFWHVMGPTDKAEAMKWLQVRYQEKYASDTLTLALGDSPNDREMLLAADVAVVLPGKNPDALKDLKHPDIHFADQPAPAGWNSAVNQFLNSNYD